MAAQTCCLDDPAVNHNDSFEAEDSVSANVAVNGNELSGSELSRIVGDTSALRRVLASYGSWHQPTRRC